MRGTKQKTKTFLDDKNYFFALDGETEKPFIVTEDKQVIGLENPFLIIANKRLFGNPDNQYQNALGDKLKAGLSNIKDKVQTTAQNVGGGIKTATMKVGMTAQNVGGKVTDAVKDTIQNPKETLQKIGSAGKNLLNNAKEIGGKLVGGAIDAGKKVAFSIPRQAFLGLVALNFGGFATRYFNRSEADRKKVIDKWEDTWGGDRGSLEGSLNTGRNKKPLIISKKKRAMLAQETANATAFDGSFLNVAGADDAGVLASIATATPIITSLMGLIKALKPVNAKQDADIDAEENTENQNDGQLTPAEQLALQQAEQATRDLINANTTLTTEQKDALLKSLDSGAEFPIEEPTFFEKNKVWIIGGIAVLAIGIIAYAISKRNN